MKTIKKGDTVAIIENGDLKRGTVKDIFILDQPLAVVAFEGELKKICLKDLIKVEEESTEDIEPQEKSEVTITPDRLKRVMAHITSKLMVEHKDIATEFMFMSAILYKDLYKALFLDEAEQ